MKRTISLLFLSVAVMFALSLTARAQDDPSIYFNQVVGGNGAAGIYQGTLTGTSGPPWVNFECADDVHGIQGGENWQATAYYGLGTNDANAAIFETYVTGSSTGYNQNAGYAGHGTVINIQSVAEAWLMEAYLEYAQITEFGLNSNADVAAISDAIWSITNGIGGNRDSESNPDLVTSYIDAAFTAYSNGTAALDAALVIFYVPIAGTASNYPTGDPNPQLFSTVTPEPLSMALMGTFLTLAGLALGKKKLFS